MSMQDITIMIPERGGAVPEVWEALRAAAVSVEAALSFSREHHRVVHVVVDDDAVDAGRSAIESAGFLIVDQREILLVDLADHPGGLAEVTRIAYDSGAGVYLLSMATSNRVMLGVADLAAAQQAFGVSG